MKNYVRNSEYTIEMIKNIVTKLEENEEWEEHENETSNLNRPHDILIHNIKLSTILEGFDIDINNIEPHIRIIENGKEDEDKEEKSAVKVKVIDPEVMTLDEAITQMEMLDHDFFSFINEANHRHTVVYVRKDGGYGTIETKE